MAGLGKFYAEGVCRGTRNADFVPLGSLTSGAVRTFKPNNIDGAFPLGIDNSNPQPAAGLVFFFRRDQFPWQGFGSGRGVGAVGMDEPIAKWNENAGPRVGDWCILKSGAQYRFGRDLGDSFQLADQSGIFALGSDGTVTYSGAILDYPSIQKSSLAQQSERTMGSLQHGANSAHSMTPCRVFKEN
jgi:hypothetical protein